MKANLEKENHPMHRSISIVVSAIALALTISTTMVPVAVSQDATGSVVTSTGNHKVSGTVVSDDNNIVVIMNSAGERLTFRLEENAFVPINMVVGSPVEVTYVPSGSEFVASRILMAYPDQQNLASSQSGSGYYAQGPDTRYDTRYDATQRYDGNELPATAGWLPLVGLAGLASIAAGFGARKVRR
jgi:hypothetical protein